MANGSDSRLRNSKACVVIFTVIFMAIPTIMPLMQKNDDYITTALSLLYKDHNASMVYDKASSVKLALSVAQRPMTGPNFVEALQKFLTQWTAKVDNSCLEENGKPMDPTLKAGVSYGTCGAAVLLAIIFACCLPSSIVCCCGGLAAFGVFFTAVTYGIIAFLAFQDSSGMGSLDCTTLVPWIGDTIGADAAEAAYSAYPSSFINAKQFTTTVANISTFAAVMPKIYSEYGNASAQPPVEKCQNFYIVTSSVEPTAPQAIITAWATKVQGSGVDLGLKATTKSFYSTVFSNVDPQTEAFCKTMISNLSTFFFSVAITMIVLTVVALCLACFCARSACIARELTNVKPPISTVVPQEETGLLQENVQQTAAPKKASGFCSRSPCCARN